MIAPIVDELAKNYAGKVLFGKLNVDENKDAAMRFQITSILTLLIFKHGKLVNRVIGVMPRNVLEARITHHLEPT